MRSHQESNSTFDNMRRSDLSLIDDEGNEELKYQSLPSKIEAM
jgi:hypothetical protein